jgi:hypothetical protein
MSFVMHEVVYFGRGLPWFIMSFIPYFDQYKIQGVGWHDMLRVKLADSRRQKSLPCQSSGLAQGSFL